MNRKLILVAALATFATAGAHAFQGEQYPIAQTPFQSSQTRAEVRAETQQAAGQARYGNGGTGVHAPTRSSERAAVKAQALVDTRNGQATYSEM